MLHRQKTQSATRSLKRPDSISFPDQPSPSRIARVLLDEVIRLRAYELYLARGGAPGDAMEDWLRAEREYFGGDSLSEPLPIAPSRRGHTNGAGAR